MDNMQIDSSDRWGHCRQTHGVLPYKLVGIIIDDLHNFHVVQSPEWYLASLSAFLAFGKVGAGVRLSIGWCFVLLDGWIQLQPVGNEIL